MHDESITVHRLLLFANMFIFCLISYGARIWEAHRDSNTDVMFHLRNENYEHCIKHGIDVTSYHGDLRIPAEELLAFSTTEEMSLSAKGGIEDDEGFDWVVCALKSTSLNAVPKLIEPLISPKTRLLMIMNGLIEDDFIQMMREQQERKGLKGVGCKAIYGGMALICSNRISPGKHNGMRNKQCEIPINASTTAITIIIDLVCHQVKLITRMEVSLR